MILTIFTFLIVLSILVLIHELGHYTVARLIGVKVEEFGFGLPPRIWGKKIGQTVYSLNALPIGGFVRLQGEDAEADTIENTLKKHSRTSLKQYFWARSVWARAAVLLAGVTMNFVLAVGITSYLITQGIEEPEQQVKIEEITPGSPAAVSGLEVGDKVTSIVARTAEGNLTTFPTRIPDELVAVTKDNLGREIRLFINRNGSEMQLSVTPRKNYPAGEGPMGIRIGYDVRTIKFPWYQAPWEGFKLTLSRGRDMIVAIASLPGRALQGQKIQNEVAGPIGIAQVTGEAARVGVSAVLNLMSILSLSLALLNVLPFPALDGGRLLFVVIEAITGTRVKPAFERNAHQMGMLALLLLIALVTLNDLTRLIHF